MDGELSCQPNLVVAVAENVNLGVLTWSAMSVVKVVTLHANVAYGLVLEAWVVEDAAAEAQGAAVAVAQDIVGAQAMVEGTLSVLK
jgi:hypothetical protein